MVACAACGEENAERARFCSQCGGPLAVATVPVREERKVVTVLFCDLVGFTSRSEGMDVEDVRGTLQPYHELLRRELERHGGTVEKFIGDAVMALFGAPVAHEDDAERAVRAALSIQEAVGELRESDTRLDLHVRIGVNTGEALVALGADPARGEGMASGDVVNTAARLQTAAPVDGVLVGEQTYRATDRAISYEPSQPVEAKGKTEPLPVWVAREPVSALPEQTREELPLVGRTHERAVLLDAFGRAREGPAAQLVTLIGPPGIGKSRLVAELFAAAEALPGLVTWRRGRSLAYGEGVALWALGEIVKAQAGILESDTAEVAAGKLDAAVAAAVSDSRDRAWLRRHLRPLVGVDDEAAAAGEGSQVEAVAAWRLFFEALAEARPTVLVFEDAHWADDVLLDFIDLLADRAGAVPLLIVCVARPELLERRSAWGGGKINSSTVGLGPLSGEDTARLVGQLLGQAMMPAEVQQALLERAEGNPLYAQEFVRMLQDGGLLRDGPGGWALHGEIEGLPESIQGIVASRLDTLSGPEKALVQDAAVVGKTAWVGACGALTERDAWEADELLHALERKQLVQRVRRSSIGGEVEFRFVHMLTRDVAYGQIRRADRAQKHERVAAWIERLAAGREDKAELLAAHYAQALRLREQLGEDTSGIVLRARAASAEAAHRAAAVHAHAAAARHYADALALTAEEDVAERAPLLLGWATALWICDSDARDALETAVAAQRQVQAWERAARAERMLAHWYEHHEARGEDADAHYAAAAELASWIPPTDLMCHIAVDQCLRLSTSGRVREALELCDRVLPLADAAGLVVGHALLLSWRGHGRVALGDSEGIRDSREGAAVLAREGHRVTVATYNNLAEAARGLGDMAAANEWYATAIRWAERFGASAPFDWVSAEQASQAYHAGDWDAALDALGGLNLENRYTNALACAFRGRISLARGDPVGALADAGVTIEFATATNNDEALYTGIALEAPCLAAAGRGRQAQRACDRFLDRWIGTGGITGRAIDLCELAPVLAAAGRGDDLRRAALLLVEASRWRVPLLALSEGRFAEAASGYAGIGSRPLETTSLLLAAERARARGAHADADVYAGRVLVFAREVRAVAWQRQAGSLLEPTAPADTA